MRKRPLRIISNFKNLDRVIPAGAPLHHKYLGEAEDWRGALRFLWKSLRSDVVIMHTVPCTLLLLCVVRRLCPFLRFRLVSVDLILRTPKTRKARLKARCMRRLLGRVDRFILYFKNVQAYRRFYGIRRERITFVPFKVNDWEKLATRQNEADGDYVLCAGRTWRDTKTFVEALRRTGCPGVLLQQRRELLEEHGTPAWEDELPPNVRLVVDDSQSHDKYADFISRARLLVLPRFRDNIAATGVGTYLVAMALNRCVIISAGPGAEDVLSDEAIIVPPEDPVALAQQIDWLWHDHDLRREIAARGRRYAEEVQGEERLLRDVLHVSTAGLLTHQQEAARISMPS